MADKIVTLAMFHDPMAAEMTRNRLAAEGIPAMVTGDNTGALFGGLGGAFGMVHLQVAEENLERATRLLDAWEEKDDEGEDSPALPKKKRRNRQRDRAEDMPPPTEDQPPETGIATKPMSPAPETEEEKEDEDRPILVGPDKVVQRALTAALLGALLMFVGNITHAIAHPAWPKPFVPWLLPGFIGLLFALPVLGYSLFLLFRLMGTTETLSARGMRYLYLAMLFNFCAWGLFFVLLMGFRLY